MTGLFAPQKSGRGMARSEAAAGWILLEILATLVLLSLVIGPLVTGLISAVDRAAASRAEIESGDTVQGGVATDTGASAWEWGPRVVSAVWHPGPALETRVATRVGGAGGRGLVGIWIDGWFRGEESPDDKGLLTLKADCFAGSFGQELILRVREDDGCWGPPWRLVVPDAYETLAVTSPAAGRESVLASAEIESYTAVHVPGSANPRIEMSGSSMRLLFDSLAFPLFLTPADPGDNDLVVDGQRQSWLMENGRALDLYF